MEKRGDRKAPDFLGSVLGFLRKCLFSVLSYGSMPNHIAFIMDGNRRFAKSRNDKTAILHRGAGFSALVSILQYCYEMGVKYVTVYAFSIDNFRRKPDEVELVMDLLQEKIGELLREESIVNKYGVKINFWGNLDLLREPVRLAAEKAMASTAGNTGPVLSVCVAYTSTYEILNAVQKSFAEKSITMHGCHTIGKCNDLVRDNDTGVVSVSELEKHLYTTDCPDPDIVVRTSGETRLSNFLLWQTTYCHLQNPVTLWPEFSLRHLVWTILDYQRVFPYLEERKSSSGNITERISST